MNNNVKLGEDEQKWIKLRYQEGYTKSQIKRATGAHASVINKVLDGEPKMRHSKYEYLPTLVFDIKNLTLNKDLVELTRKRWSGEIEVVKDADKLKAMKDSQAKLSAKKKKTAAKEELPKQQTEKKELIVSPSPEIAIDTEPEYEFLISKKKFVTYIQPRKWDIYYCDIPKHEGSVQHGKRPVIILQNNISNFLSSTIICVPCTSKDKGYYPTHILIEKDKLKSDLKTDSIVMCEQIMTVDQSMLGDYLGTLVNTDLEERIENGIKIALGFVQSMDLTYMANKKIRHENEDLENTQSDDVVTENIYVMAKKQDKGAMYLECPECKIKSSYFLHKFSDHVDCKFCNHKIEFDDVTRFEYNCTCTDKLSYGKTNLKTDFSRQCTNKNCMNKIMFKYDEERKAFLGEISKGYK